MADGRELVLGVFGREVGFRQRQPGAGEVGGRGHGLRGAGLQVVHGLPGELGLVPRGGEHGLLADDTNEAAGGLSQQRAAVFLPGEPVGFSERGGRIPTGAAASGPVERTAELQRRFQAPGGAEFAGAEGVFELEGDFRRRPGARGILPGLGQRGAEFTGAKPRVAGLDAGEGLAEGEGPGGREQGS